MSPDTSPPPRSPCSPQQRWPVVSWNFGVGSAMSVLLLLFLLVVSGAYLLITNRRRHVA